MVLTEQVEVKITASNMSYWRDLGYIFPNPAPRWGIIPKIEVRVSELKAGSNVSVDCKCDRCEILFTRKLSNNTTRCNLCMDKSVSKRMKGNTLGKAHKGKKLPHMMGENHPRFNPNKTQFKEYSAKVRSITRLQDLTTLENFDKLRGMCGVEGAYQLDHITSIKRGFLKDISPEIIGDISNLQFIPWRENRNKAAR